MRRMGTEVKVGIFSLCSMAIIAYMVFVLSPDTFNNKNGSKYFTVVTDAAGIVKNTHVKTNGVTVGKVSDILLDLNNTRIVFSVDQSVQIPIGSSVAIREKGLLGDVFLEIIRAEDNGQYIAPNTMVPPSGDSVNISELVSIAGSVGKDIKEVTSILAAVFGGEDGKDSIKDILSNMKEIVANSNAIVKENRDDIRSVVASLKETTTSLRDILGGQESDLKVMLSDFKTTTKNLKEFSKSMRDVMDPQNKETINNIIASFDKTMHNVELTSKNVKLVADKIEQGEGTLGKLINDDQSIEHINAAIKDIREVLAPATKSQLIVDYRGEVRKDSSTQHYFNTYMQTRPDKFYLLGFTDLAESVTERLVEKLEPESTSSEVIVDETSPIKTRERTTVSKAIRFNLQFGKRWNFAQLRFGLFESSGGIASDLYLFGDRLSLSLEAFDWNNQSLNRETAHFKVYGKLMFWKHISAVFGVDDISRFKGGGSRAIDEPNYYVGGGINFDDRDLKSLLGAASLAL